MANNSKSARAIKAFRHSFIELYKQKSIEDITVEELVRNTEYSRSSFYFHFSGLNEFVRFIEQQVLDDLGTYFVLPSDMEQMQAVRRGAMPSSCVTWLNKCKKHKGFLVAALGPHGNPSFVYRLKKSMYASIREMFMFDGLPNDNITTYVIELFSGGILSMLYHCFQSGGDEEFRSLFLALGYLRSFRIIAKHTESAQDTHDAVLLEQISKL
jgi:AcrR family transcriptional regulator